MTATKTDATLKRTDTVDRLYQAIAAWVRREVSPLAAAQSDLAARVAELERVVAQQRVELLRLRADPER